MSRSLALTAKTPLGGNVWAFTFEPDQPLNWNPGQAIRIELPHKHPDTEGTKRYFTITSAPFERTITITTRLTESTFKQALAQLPIQGTVTLLDPPAGTFVWPRIPGRPVVLVAQGIGITPFISLMRQRQHDGSPLAATLVHTNLTLPAPFQDELAAIAAHHPGLIVHHETRPVTAAHLLELVPRLPHADVLVSGPRPLLELLAPPVNLPLRQHQYDQFTGYGADHY